MGCGCGMTCWRRLRDWGTRPGFGRGSTRRCWPSCTRRTGSIGAWCDRQQLRPAAVVDGRARALSTAARGSKHQIITDAGGIPLVADTTAANVPDVNPMIPLVDAIPPMRGKPGRRCRRPASLYGDRGYDSDPHRRKSRANSKISARNSEFLVEALRLTELRRAENQRRSESIFALKSLLDLWPFSGDHLVNHTVLKGVKDAVDKNLLLGVLLLGVRPIYNLFFNLEGRGRGHY